MPPKFAVDDEEAWKIVDDAGAGMLVIQTPEGMASVYVPILVSDDRRVLVTHVARANPWWKAVGEGADVLALFLAASAYVTPSNYPSRLENPGRRSNVELRSRGDSWQGHDSRRPRVEVASDRTRDGTFRTRSRSRVARATIWISSFAKGQLQAIVGIEIEVVSIEGKAKLSQNRPEIDRVNVREQLSEGSLERTQRGTANGLLPRSNSAQERVMRPFRALAVPECGFSSGFFDRGAQKPVRRPALRYFLVVRKNTGGVLLARVVPFTSRGIE